MDILLLIPLGIFVIFAVINCAIRGRKRSLVRMVFILLSGALAIFLTPKICEKYVKAEPLWQLQEGSALSELSAVSPSLDAAISGAQGALWSIIVYPAVFLLLCIFMTIPVSIINRKTERTHKGSGALIGIVVGLLVFSLAFAPLCAAGRTAGDSLKDILRKEWDLEDFNEHFGLNLNLDKILNSDKVMRAEAIPGEPMLDLLTTVQKNGKKISVSAEIRNLMTLLPYYKTLDEDMTRLPEALSALADCAEKSDFLTQTFDEIQTAAREKWSNKEAFLGYNPKKPDGGFGELLAKKICGSETNLSPRELADEFIRLLEQ